MRHNQMDYLRHRVEAEEQAASASKSVEARQVHAELALRYRAEILCIDRTGRSAISR
jgi:hypothetical protein